MLPSNIENEVLEILKKNNGWLRTEECAKKYAKDDATKRTQFYRWRKKVLKGIIKDFQVVNLPRNISFIGLKDADPRFLESFFAKDKKLLRSLKDSFGLFDWLDKRAEKKGREEERIRKELLAQNWTYLELGSKIYGKDAKALEDLVEIEKKNRRELGLDEKD